MSLSSKNMPGGYRDPLYPHYPEHDMGNESTIARKAFSPLLDALKAQGYDTDTIASFLRGYSNSWGSVSTERNDALLQYLLGQTATQNQRMYDESVRDEQRNYDLPTNIMQRLQAAGISRDAAIQMLSGGAGSGAGAGSLIGSGLGANGAQVPAPSGTMDLASVNTAINGAASVVDSMCAMVNTGMSAYTAYEQGNLLKAQASMTQNQATAYQLSGKAYNLISQGVADGIVDNSDGMVFANVKNAQQALETMAKAGNVEAQEMHANGSIRQLGELSPYSSEYLSHLYETERRAKDYSISFANEQRKADSLVALQGVQIDSLAQGILQSEAQIQDILASAEYKRESLVLIDAQIKLMEKQGKNLDANSLYQKALTRKTALENELQSSWQDADVPVQRSPGISYVKGSDIYGMETLSKLRSGAQAALKLESGRYWEKEVQNQFADIDNLLALNALRHLYYGNTADFLTTATPEQKHLMGLADAYSSSHVFDYMDRLINNNKTSFSILGISGTQVDYPAHDVVNGSLNIK